MSSTVSHTIDTDVDTFWRLFFDIDLARAMIEDLGNVGGFNIVEERTDAQGLRHRRIECWSNVELPDFVKKLIGDGSYTEVGCFDPVRKTYNAECIPKHNAEKFGTKFEVTAVALDGGKRCERRVATVNKVKVFGIGSMIEGLLERTQREGHDRSARFINNWIHTKLGA